MIEAAAFLLVGIRCALVEGVPLTQLFDTVLPVFDLLQRGK